MSEKKRVITSSSSVSQATPNSKSDKTNEDRVFKRINFLYMGVGIVLIFLGLLLMSGGHMPSPDVWDESIIYSARRTVIAPILILAGLVVEIVAIFKR